MPDLTVVALVPAKPGSEGAVRDALTALTSASREEAGCVSYDLYDSTATPGTFVTVEVWRSQADLETHMQGPGIAAALGALGDHLAGAPAIHPLSPVA